MKKLFITVLSFLFVAPVWAKTARPISYQLAEAIGASNYKKVQKLLPQLRDNKKDRLRGRGVHCRKKELSPGRFISSAVRAQLCEFLVSNILVTSLSSGCARGQPDDLSADPLSVLRIRS